MNTDISKAGEAPILIVDDEPMILALIEDCACRRGLRPLRASNGREALGLVAGSDPIQMVVTDLQMPEMGGLDLVRELRAADPDLPVIFVSGCCADFSAVQAHLNANTLFLEKPFDFKTLGDKIEDLLRRAASDLEPRTGHSWTNPKKRHQLRSRHRGHIRPVS